MGGRKTTNRISPSGKAHGSVGKASEQNGGGVGTCYLCFVLCHLVIHPAGPRTWRASGRRTLTWGSAQTRAPCPLFLLSAEIQSDFIHLPREPRFLPGEATSRVWDLAEGRGNLLSDAQTASLAHAAVCVTEPRQSSPSKPKL